MNKELSLFQTGYGTVRKTTKADDLADTAINARKSMETANLQHHRDNADAQKNVSDYFAHSHDMALKHYSRKTCEDVVMARNFILKLTDSEAGPYSDPTPDAAQPEESNLIGMAT